MRKLLYIGIYILIKWSKKDNGDFFYDDFNFCDYKKWYD